MLQAEQRLDQLPQYAAGTPIPAGTRLTAAQHRAVDSGDLTGDVALHLAVYATAETTAACT